MKVALACIAVIAAVANVAEGTLDAGLRVKFDTGTDPSSGTSYFFKVPITIAEAKEDGWRQTRRPPGPLPQLVMYCSWDKIVCPLFDDLENVAGLQIALNKNDFTNNAFDWETRGFREWRTAVDGQCVTMYALQQYFVSEESLQKSKEERLAARDSTRVLQENAIWLTGTDGELLKVASSEADIEDIGFTKQACVPWMGQHWYYNMSSTTSCDARGIYPWFTMTLEEELIASGFMTFGRLPVGEQRDWFERPDIDVIKMIVPSGPECLYNMVDNGVLTMHIYYTDTPWLITC